MPIPNSRLITENLFKIESNRDSVIVFNKIYFYYEKSEFYQNPT